MRFKTLTQYVNWALVPILVIFVCPIENTYCYRYRIIIPEVAVVWVLVPFISFIQCFFIIIILFLCLERRYHFYNEKKYSSGVSILPTFAASLDQCL